MRVVITGGSGFLGLMLAERIAQDGLVVDGSGARNTPEQIVLLDQVAASTNNPVISSLVGDVTDADLIAKAITPDTTAVFHLAAIVSAHAEADFDLGMAVNLDATRAILERCRSADAPPRLVFPSSVAAFGGDGGIMSAAAANRPRSSYGTQKAIGELLVNDFSRKGFIDGRAIRLPTVVVRPGKPNKAASSFASSIIREPLNGERAVCPVGSDLRLWLASPEGAIAGLIHAHDIAPERLPEWRALNLPGLSTTVGEMVAALDAQGGDTSLIDWIPDPAIEAIVATWPAEIETEIEHELGFKPDTSLDALVVQYKKLMAAKA